MMWLLCNLLDMPVIKMLTNVSNNTDIHRQPDTDKHMHRQTHAYTSRPWQTHAQTDTDIHK